MSIKPYSRVIVRRYPPTMDIWVAVVGGFVGAFIGAIGTWVVEGRRSRLVGRERLLERRIEAYAEVAGQAQALYVVLAEPASRLSSKSFLGNPTASVRSVNATFERLNMSLNRAYLVSDGEMRSVLAALQRATIESCQRVIEGSGVEGIQLAEESRAFLDAAATVVDGGIPDHKRAKNVNN